MPLLTVRRIACGPAALGSAIALGALAPPALAVDARVTAVQVTQSVQSTTGNPVPLAADRSTAIRAVVRDVDGATSSVTGRAHVTVDGVRVTPPQGIAPINAPLDPVGNPSLDVEGDTLCASVNTTAERTNRAANLLISCLLSCCARSWRSAGAPRPGTLAPVNRKSP